MSDRRGTGVFPLTRKRSRPQDARVAQASQLIENGKVPSAERRTRKPRPRPGRCVDCVVRSLQLMRDARACANVQVRMIPCMISERVTVANHTLYDFLLFRRGLTDKKKCRTDALCT